MDAIWVIQTNQQIKAVAEQVEAAFNRHVDANRFLDNVKREDFEVSYRKASPPYPSWTDAGISQQELREAIGKLVEQKVAENERKLEQAFKRYLDIFPGPAHFLDAPAGDADHMMICGEMHRHVLSADCPCKPILRPTVRPIYEHNHMDE